MPPLNLLAFPGVFSGLLNQPSERANTVWVPSKEEGVSQTSPTTSAFPGRESPRSLYAPGAP